MIRFKWYVSGDIFAVKYNFERDDALPRHAHDPANEHNVVVLSGRVSIDIEGEQIKEIAAPEIVDFDGSKLHTIKCISDRACTLNMWLHGMPDGYAQLPESERQGTL